MGHANWVVPDLPAPNVVRPARWVRDDLILGEEVVWHGRPGIIRPIVAALPATIFGVLFGGVALAIYLSASPPNHENLGLNVIAIPFVLLGSLMTLAPVWAGWQAVRTRYAITNQRVIIRQPRFWAGMQTISLGPDSMANLIRTERFGGRGDLFFERLRPLDRREPPTARRGFLAIPRVRNVEKLLRTTLQAPLAARAER